MAATLTKDQLEFLQSMDTPTVCNVVEMVAPERRGHGYTVKHLFCPFPDLPPIVGFAKTVTAKAKDKVALGSYMEKRMDYLDYIAAAPRPSIAVIEDLDDEVGYGAFWGEVQSNIHKALGCLGVVTNGSIRDIPMIAQGFQMLAGSLVALARLHACGGLRHSGHGARHEGEQRRSHSRRPARRGRGAAGDHSEDEGRARRPQRARGAHHQGREGSRHRGSDQGRDQGRLTCSRCDRTANAATAICRRSRATR